MVKLIIIIQVANALHIIIRNHSILIEPNHYSRNISKLQNLDDEPSLIIHHHRNSNNSSEGFCWFSSKKLPIMAYYLTAKISAIQTRWLPLYTSGRCIVLIVFLENFICIINITRAVKPNRTTLPSWTWRVEKGRTTFTPSKGSHLYDTDTSRSQTEHRLCKRPPLLRLQQRPQTAHLVETLFLWPPCVPAFIVEWKNIGTGRIADNLML